MEQEISKQFLCGLPINKIEWNEILGLMSESDQERLLQITVNHPVYKKHPVKSSYVRLFLKKILDQVEKSEGSVNELIYEEYVKLLQKDDSAYAFKSYFIPDLFDYVPIEESCCLLSNGTTGLTTWEGSFALTEFMLANKNILNGMNVLELGSGVGFAGIALCRTCKPAGYCFSDYHGDVMSLLARNLQLNFPETIIRSNVENVEGMISGKGRDESNSDSGNGDYFSNSKSTECDLSILKLDWCNPPVPNTFNDFLSKTEIVLAADVVFDPSLVPHLVNTLSHVILYPLRQTSMTAFFALTVRSPETYDLFVKEVKKYKLTLERIDYQAPHVFYFDRSSDVRLLKITSDANDI